MEAQKQERNEQGNLVLRAGTADFTVGLTRGTNRYFYDQNLAPDDGWQQYDTKQDASYFGVWVNLGEQLIFTYAEGDRTLVICQSPHSMRAELEAMNAFYGPTPPAFRVIDAIGQITHIHTARPGL